MKTVIYNIGTLAGILPADVRKLEGEQMNRVECLHDAYLVIEDGVITEFGSNLEGSGFQNRATPLAAGVGSDYANSPVDFCSEQPAAAGVVGARSEGVGGVVFPTAFPSASKASARINVTDNSGLGLPRAVVRMACSKGTYVRAFARDLGEALGSGAHLDSLQRSRSGNFCVEDALTVDQAIALLRDTQSNDNQ